MQNKDEDGEPQKKVTDDNDCEHVLCEKVVTHISIVNLKTRLAHPAFLVATLTGTASINVTFGASPQVAVEILNAFHLPAVVLVVILGNIAQLTATSALMTKRIFATVKVEHTFSILDAFHADSIQLIAMLTLAEVHGRVTVKIGIDLTFPSIVAWLQMPWKWVWVM